MVTAVSRGAGAWLPSLIVVTGVGDRHDGGRGQGRVHATEGSHDPPFSPQAVNSVRAGETPFRPAPLETFHGVPGRLVGP